MMPNIDRLMKLISQKHLLEQRAIFYNNRFSISLWPAFFTPPQPRGIAILAHTVLEQVLSCDEYADQISKSHRYRIIGLGNANNFFDQILIYSMRTFKEFLV